MKKIILASILITSLFNTYAVAGFGSGIKYFIDDITTNIVATVGYLFMTVSVVVFLFGMVEFVLAQREGKDAGIKAGKNMMTWGILALFVIFSVPGIINFMQRTLSQGTSTDFSQRNINVPRFQFGGSDPSITPQAVQTGNMGITNTSGLGGSGSGTTPCASGGTYCPNGLSCSNTNGTFSCQ